MQIVAARRSRKTASTTAMRVAVSLVLLIATAMPAGIAGASPPNSPPANGPSPVVATGRVLSGAAAVKALGTDISRVAAAHGKSVAQLARALRSDRRLAVDPNGRLFYREAALPQASEPAGGSSSAAAAPFPLADTFTLHSLPEAQRVIYLDFDGHALSGTSWNRYNAGADIPSVPWDVEGGPGVFTDSERLLIQQVWQRVAEDYAPFGVDVTTEAPEESRLTRSSLSDELYGVRVLISPLSSYLGAYGGLAYVGVFDMVGDFYKPALVFPERLANHEKYIAEAAAHEAGHTLGLLHDGTTTGSEYYLGHGTGETGWAPIMGSGYYRNATQWSRGEYGSANNFEDDLVVITQNGAPVRADDHGDAPASATWLLGGQLRASGVVASAQDVDTLAFNAGAGTVSLSAAPAARGANLDIGLELRDSAGRVVASANPPSTLGSSLSTTVNEGTYYVFVKGVGTADPTTGYSSYASIGAWTLTGTAPVSGQSVPPVARVRATPENGTAPLAIDFSGLESYDPDGTIVSWAWSFGDGSTGSGDTVSHTYSSPGSYQCVLTVTDDAGLKSSANTTIEVASPPVTKSIHVEAIDLTILGSGRQNYGEARVLVVDAQGLPLLGATVTGVWSGVASGTSSAVTGANGIAVVDSRTFRRTGTIEFAVSDVFAEGCVYDASSNAVSSVSYTPPSDGTDGGTKTPPGKGKK